MNGEPIQFDFDNTFATRFEGFYVPCHGDEVPAPEIVAFNRNLATQLGLDPDALNSEVGAAILTGSVSPRGAAPLAQVYAGHQFGGFAPRLGDGRALLIGEVIDADGQRRDIQLKGSGRTPFSRQGDGKAVLAPVLREYLVAEAMHALSIPTTRALSATLTGEKIMRTGWQPGAVLARVAASHLRVGTLQFFAARGETDKVRSLADYAIERHYPELVGDDDRYIGLIRAVGNRHARLVAQWMHVGFVHGVMNTDNMTLSGETIDYGPCAFIDAYNPRAVFSSIDYMGRYAYANQPAIAQWNLARLAETLLPLIEPDDEDKSMERASAEIDVFMNRFEENWLAGMGKKIGLADAEGNDVDLIQDLLAILHKEEIDFTRFFRILADGVRDTEGAVNTADESIKRFEPIAREPKALEAWLNAWRKRLTRDPQSNEVRRAAMNAINPIYIPRNHHVEHALQRASQEADFAPFHALRGALTAPYDAKDSHAEFAEPPPTSFEPYITYCGT